jgi:hypothetical protein
MGFAAFSDGGDAGVFIGFFLLKRKSRDFGQGKRRAIS